MATEFFAGSSRERVLANYIRDIADRMGLRDWQFVIRPESCGHPFASTEVWGHSKTADISFGEGFFKLGPKGQREVVVHELCHWHSDVADTWVRTVAENTLAQATFDLYIFTWKQHYELMTDNIAAAWAREFPLINWRSKKKLYYKIEHNELPRIKTPDS